MFPNAQTGLNRMFDKVFNKFIPIAVVKGYLACINFPALLTFVSSTVLLPLPKELYGQFLSSLLFQGLIGKTDLTNSLNLQTREKKATAARTHKRTACFDFV